MNIKNVLVPTDFSDISKTALSYGIFFARKFQAKLTLVHVTSMPRSPKSAGPAELARRESIQRTHLTSQLFDQVSPGDHRNLDLRVVIKAGNVRKELDAAIREEQADIVILGTHGKRGFDRFFLGSTTEGLLRKLPVPILTVREVAESPVFNRILFATDFSESASDDFALALDLAKGLQSEVTVLHVVPGAMALSEGAGIEANSPQAANDEGRQRLNAFVSEGARQGVRVLAALAEGQPAEEILVAAREKEAALIFLNVKPRGAIRRVFLGTTAERVVREARVPVLTVSTGVGASLRHEQESSGESAPVALHG